jgi:hypothetical protein
VFPCFLISGGLHFIFNIFVYLIYLLKIGNALQSDQDVFMKAGVSKVLVKPLDIDVLQKTFQGM